MRNFFCFALAVLSACVMYGAENGIQPSGTYLYAVKDTASLYLDIYDPSPGSVTEIDGIAKPTLLYMFGGGFKGGRRNDPEDVKWFARLTSDGFRVISIDYRLGLKNARNIGPAQWKQVYNAIQMATEDLFSATAFIIENASELGVDPAAIVISGSSAGAITAMQGEWELCRRSAIASALPEDFRYAGVMSFAGAVFSTDGAVRYDSSPAPTLMVHGTADRIVDYGDIAFFSVHFSGAGALAKEFARKSDCHHILRYRGHSHEMAVNQMHLYPQEMFFLEHNVMKKEKIVIDSTIDDPTIAIPDWVRGKTGKDLYE